MYTYSHPHPAVTVDCAVFSFQDDFLKILLVKRKSEPFAGKWALPGGYVDINETCENAATRELAEETGIKASLTQFHTYSEVGRDPRERTISVAFLGECKPKGTKTVAGDDAAEAKWFNIYKLPELAFDHQKIAEAALTELRNKSKFGPLGMNLLPEKFRFNDLYSLYETVLDQKINRIFFKNKIDRMGHLLKVDENDLIRNPLVKFNTDLYQNLMEEGCLLSFE
jgi:8-oxo-dGTP diphosphatase